VAGDDPLDAEGGEGGDGRLDDRLEHGPGQVEAAHEPGDAVAAGQPLGVAEHVDGAGVGAAGHDHQALVGHVDDHVLVVEDQRGRAPSRRRPGPCGWGSRSRIR
jgi:hypothetical protein